MKTTLDIPDPIFRQAKALAALRGVSLRQFVADALEEKISAPSRSPAAPSAPPWMRGFGALADLGEESRRVEQIIAGAFETLEDEDRV